MLSASHPMLAVFCALVVGFGDYSNALDTASLRAKVDLCRRVGFNPSSLYCSDMASWDTSDVRDMSNLFRDATKFNADISRWNTGRVTSMRAMFRDATHFNANIGAWDTRNVNDMSSMFRNTDTFNIDLSRWNTGRVTTMAAMFRGARVFNGNLAGWDTHAVRTMVDMFRGATKFNNAGVSQWNTARVTDMTAMFSSATEFNADISRWDTHATTHMSKMFQVAPAFNRNLASWNTSRVEYMTDMFKSATSFNGDVSTWVTTSVVDMASMFLNAREFNADISRWDTSSVQSMLAMFTHAVSFNANLAAWDTSNVRETSYMFQDARVFNADISGWDVANVRTLYSMFVNTPAFNVDLCGWELPNADRRWIDLMFRAPPDALASAKFSLCDANECLLQLPPQPCPTSTTCENTLGSFSCNSCSSSVTADYTCTCSSGYSWGDDGECVDVDECAAGTHLCDSSQHACVNTEGSFVCATRVLSTSKCFFVPSSTEKRTWLGADRRCKEMGAGLATVSAHNENAVIFSIWTSLAIGDQRDSHGGMWIGANDRENEGSFEWPNGSPIDSATTEWSNIYGNQQPNNYFNQDCVSYGYSNLGGWSTREPVRGWADNDCEATRQPFLCEISC